jgi:hypothetical protein
MTVRPYTLDEKWGEFGRFRWTYAPQPQNPEHIAIADAWTRANLESVKIPQLSVLAHGPRVGIITLHQKASQPFLDFFAALAQRSLLPLVRSFDGSWAPRFVRQHGTPAERQAACLAIVGRPDAESRLSNHAWGTAIDLNAALWPLGRPCPESSEWRQVVAVANECGLFWGGDYHARPDAMHFEVGVVE